jgi:8-oxo-dGTP pyrophosphatase MutT (NUDIX family)
MSPRIDLLAQRLSQRSAREIEMNARDQAAIALILAPSPEHSSLEFLLIQRAEHAGDPWSGHMALPGGRRDVEDADLRATALRETREEVGVDLAGARLLGQLDDLRPLRQSDRTLAVRPFVYWAKEQPALDLSAEVAGALWVSLGGLAQTAGEADVNHRGAQLRVPAFLIEHRVVWGMTQRVLAAFLELTSSE